MKLLYIGKQINRVECGADVVNLRNQHLLMSIFGKNIDFVCPDEKTSLFKKITFGVTSSYLSRLKSSIEQNNYDFIFISQSNLGRVAKFLKAINKDLRIITFFHNVERDYGKEYIKVSFVKGFILFLLSWIYEYLSCKYTDEIIVLNERDNHRLFDIYRRHADYVLPTSLDDKFDKDKVLDVQNVDFPIDYLFVGYAFFPNIHGVQWFINNVMPFVEGNLYIVGKDMDKQSFENVTDRIHIYGYVDDLSAFYYNAKFVVSPIFLGSGMKTKTCEALMYGKTIIATSEALTGYDVVENAVYKCDTSSEFINAINRLNECHFSLFNQVSRDLFITRYSNERILSEMKIIFSK